MFNNLCVYGKCENLFGVFRCDCHDGYKLDGSGGNCTDIDECESPQSCLYGKCGNLEGSYKCSCPANHELVAGGNACIGWFSYFLNRNDIPLPSIFQIEEPQDVIYMLTNKAVRHLQRIMSRKRPVVVPLAKVGDRIVKLVLLWIARSTKNFVQEEWDTNQMMLRYVMNFQ